MALLWIEGFEGFGTSTGSAPAPTGIVGRKYGTISNESLMKIEIGTYGKCLSIPDTASLRTPSLTTDSTSIVGCAIKVSELPSSDSLILGFYDTGSKAINIRLNSNGTLVISRVNVVLGTTTFAITAGNWYYLELKVFVHDTTGTAELKINESTKLALTNQDTKAYSNAYMESFGLAYSGEGNFQYDDIYILDGSGSINNDFLGRRQVQAIRPDAAGSTTEWEPSAGANYTTVDEVQLDEDTSYVETTFTGEKDLYNYEASVGSSIIDGIQVMTEAKVTVGTMDLHTIVKSGSTEDDGDADTISSSTYVTSRRLEETNPDTSSKWTPSEVDSAQFGVKAV